MISSDDLQLSYFLMPSSLDNQLHWWSQIGRAGRRDDQGEEREMETEGATSGHWQIVLSGTSIYGQSMTYINLAEQCVWNMGQIPDNYV